MTDNHYFNLDRDISANFPTLGSNSAPALKSDPKNRKQGDKKPLSQGA